MLMRNKSAHTGTCLFFYDTRIRLLYPEVITRAVQEAGGVVPSLRNAHTQPSQHLWIIPTPPSHRQRQPCLSVLAPTHHRTSKIPTCLACSFCSSATTASKLICQQHQHQ